jgi:hypothetical protein
MSDIAIVRKPRSEFRQKLRLTTRANPISEEFGHPCESNQHLQPGKRIARKTWMDMVVGRFRLQPQHLRILLRWL